jgi:sterol desaturase/sphingolipid hydroxylase (fatty acid hydroxylase superfamily)
MQNSALVWTALNWTIYSILGCAILITYARRNGQSLKSAREVFGSVFPKNVYAHSSAIMDYWVSAINVSIAWIAYGGTVAAVLNSGLRETANRFGTKPEGVFAPLFDIIMRHSFLQPHGILATALWSLGGVMILDFVRASIHLAFHKVPALWELHKVHHNAEVLHPLTLYRVTVFEEVLTGILQGTFLGAYLALFIWIFGVEKFNILTLLGANLFIFPFHLTNKFRHSHIWLNLPPKFACLYSSPTTHLIHHSAELRHRDKNFGNIFPVWDALFGTLYIPREEEHFKIGVRTESGKAFVAPSLGYFYFGVYADALRQLMGRRRSYELETPAPVSHDGMPCWCANPGCTQVAYPFDNPKPESIGYTSFSEVWARKPRTSEILAASTLPNQIG